jgi:hypothetical protein
MPRAFAFGRPGDFPLTRESQRVTFWCAFDNPEIFPGPGG